MEFNEISQKCYNFVQNVQNVQKTQKQRKKICNHIWFNVHYFWIELMVLQSQLKFFGIYFTSKKKNGHILDVHFLFSKF